MTFRPASTRIIFTNIFILVATNNIFDITIVLILKTNWPHLIHPHPTWTRYTYLRTLLANCCFSSLVALAVGKPSWLTTAFIHLHIDSRCHLLSAQNTSAIESMTTRGDSPPIACDKLRAVRAGFIHKVESNIQEHSSIFAEKQHFSEHSHILEFTLPANTKTFIHCLFSRERFDKCIIILKVLYKYSYYYYSSRHVNYPCKCKEI